jgi:hypothetical protein
MGYATSNLTPSTQGKLVTIYGLTAKGIESCRKRMMRGECDQFLDTGNPRLENAARVHGHAVVDEPPQPEPYL